jgi:hypothetical protein
MHEKLLVSIYDTERTFKFAERIFPRGVDDPKTPWFEDALEPARFRGALFASSLGLGRPRSKEDGGAH